MKRKPIYRPFNNFGPITSGTLRSEDLLESFLSEAEERFPTHKDVLDIRAKMNALYLLEEVLEDDAFAQLEEDFYDSEWTTEAINETLFDLLGSDLPDFVGFSSHEGDGACFGYWFDHESFERSVEDGETVKTEQLPDTATKFARENGYPTLCAVVSDHGNITLYCCDEYRKGYFKFRKLYGVV